MLCSKPPVRFQHHAWRTIEQERLSTCCTARQFHLAILPQDVLISSSLKRLEKKKTVLENRETSHEVHTGNTIQLVPQDDTVAERVMEM